MAANVPNHVRNCPIIAAKRAAMAARLRCHEMTLPFHDGELPFHDGRLPFHGGEPAFHVGTVPFHGSTHSISCRDMRCGIAQPSAGKATIRKSPAEHP